MHPVLTLYFLLLTALSGLPCTAKAALPDARGLQISLVTGQSRFEIPLGAAPGGKDSFTASIALTNRGRSPVLLSYPGDVEDGVLKVTLMNASGGVVWTSETASVASGVESDSAPVPFVMAPHVTLRRTVRVPLKTADGQWLAAGRYTLRAETGLGEALAQVPIDIVGTGIRGQVFFQEFSLGPALPPEEGRIGFGWTRSDPVPIQAYVYIYEIREPNAKYDHPQFAWSGLTDSEGHFNVLTPAGRFSISAHSNNVVEPVNVVAPPPLIVSVTAGQFSTRNMTIEGWLVPAKVIIDSVVSATVEPLGDPVSDNPPKPV